MQDFTQYYSTLVPDEETLKSIIHFRTGVARVRPVARLRHQDFSPYYLPDPPDPSDPTNASKFVVSAKCSMNTQQDLPGSLDFTLREMPQLGQFNPLQDWVQIYIQFIAPDRQIYFDVPVGMYGFQIPDRAMYDSYNEWSIKGFDATWKVARVGTFSDTYTIPAGFKLTDAIKVLLMADYLPPSRGGRPATTQQTPGGSSGTGTGDSNLTSPFTATQRIGAFAGGPLGSGKQLVAGPVPFYNFGFVNYYVDTNTPRGYVRAIYNGLVPGTPPSPWEIDINGTPSSAQVTWCRDNYPTGGCPFGEGGSAWNIGGVYPPGWAPAEISAQGTFVLMGAGYGSAIPTNQYGWPDPNSPGLTPAGCDFFGPNIAANKIDIVDSPLSSPVPIMFGRKLNILAAINDLLTSMNYEKLWADQNGVLHSRPLPFYNDFIPTPTWDYSTYSPEQARALGKMPSIIHPGVTMRLADQSALANVVQVESSNNKRLPIIAVQVNENLNSPISVANLGYSMNKRIQDDNIPDQATADLRALVELQFAALAQLSVEFTTHLNPFHQAADYLGVNVTSKTGQLEISSEANSFWESGWEMDFSNREMKHVCGRAAPV